jgi:YesN/AraC family two-component response regulator
LRISFPLRLSRLQACDGQDAVRVASAYDGAIHLLITDVIMPRMSGNDLAAYFWKQRPETRVLYISGYSSPTLMQHGLRGHDTIFLEKPFTLKELSAKITPGAECAFAQSC